MKICSMSKWNISIQSVYFHLDEYQNQHTQNKINRFHYFHLLDQFNLILIEYHLFQVNIFKLNINQKLFQINIYLFSSNRNNS